MTSIPGQLDMLELIDDGPTFGLRGELGRRQRTADAEAAARDDVAERASWTARFDRAEWVAPFATAGMAAGDTVLGWLCPACGDLEPGTYTLTINHGYDPERPGRSPYGAEWGATCTRLDLQAAHERHRRAREAIS